MRKDREISKIIPRFLILMLSFAKKANISIGISSSFLICFYVYNFYHLLEIHSDSSVHEVNTIVFFIDRCLNYVLWNSYFIFSGSFQLQIKWWIKLSPVSTLDYGSYYIKKIIVKASGFRALYFAKHYLNKLR